MHIRDPTHKGIHREMYFKNSRSGSVQNTPQDVFAWYWLVAMYVHPYASWRYLECQHLQVVVKHTCTSHTPYTRPQSHNDDYDDVAPVPPVSALASVSKHFRSSSSHLSVVVRTLKIHFVTGKCIGSTCHWTQFGTREFGKLLGTKCADESSLRPHRGLVFLHRLFSLHVEPVACMRCHLAPVRYSVLGDLSPFVVICCARLFLLSWC